MSRPLLKKFSLIIALIVFSIFTTNKVSAQNENWDARFNTLGITGTLLSLGSTGSDLYAGGSFTAVGATSANNIAKWNGVSWSVLGSGTNGTVYAIAIDGSNIYVGGGFTSAGGVTVSNIAKWDGSNWSTLGTGLNGDVRAILIKASNEIYVGGLFTTAGGQSASNIAKWDGSNWTALGSGANSTVLALAHNSNLVYVGGSLTSAGGATANKIAVWNTSNSTWSTLGTGMGLGDINALLMLGTDLYAGGLFSTADGNSAKKVAKWNGSNWSALGDGITGGDINALTTVGTDLYVAGNFTTAGGGSASKIAKWNGSSWSAMGSGIDGGLVFALSSISTAVYSGGSFTTAGAKTSQKIGLWDEGGSVPIELVTFNANVVANQIQIQWTTFTEENNFGFEIERKPASEQVWEKIAFIPGNGTTLVPKHYEYFDTINSGTHDFIQYRLKQIDADGIFEYFGPIEVNFNNVPKEFSLNQNYPNPFNPQTTITFSIPTSGLTTLKVYNIKGEEILTLLQKQLAAGTRHEAVFDASNYSSGFYYYVLQAGNFMESRKMLLVK